MQGRDLPTEKLYENIHSQASEREALRSLYVRFYDQLLCYGCSIEKDEGLVHDEIQELFIWILQHPEKVQSITHIRTYLYKCLRRNIRSTLSRRRETHIHAHKYIFSTDTQENQASESTISWVEAESTRNKFMLLKQQIDDLPSHQKEVIYLRFYENLTNDEIAEIFHVSNQVVRNAIHRAMKNLRLKLSEIPLEFFSGISILLLALLS